jgi:hypothetical protein
MGLTIPTVAAGFDLLAAMTPHRRLRHSDGSFKRRDARRTTGWQPDLKRP